MSYERMTETTFKQHKPAWWGEYYRIGMPSKKDPLYTAWREAPPQRELREKLAEFGLDVENV